MEDVFQALTTNNTWTLVPRLPHTNIVSYKWIFEHKFNSDRSLKRYKACWAFAGSLSDLASTSAKLSVLL
jgi:hypothetical protein